MLKSGNGLKDCSVTLYSNCLRYCSSCSKFESHSCNTVVNQQWLLEDAFTDVLNIHRKYCSKLSRKFGKK